jgi:hypothetical protein
MKSWLDIAKEENEKFNNSELGKLTDGKVKQMEAGRLNGLQNAKSGLLKKISVKGGKSNYKKNGNPAEGRYGKPILQYDLDGNFIKEWRGAFIAANYYKVSNTFITDVAIGLRDSACGFMWKLKKSNNIKQKIKSLYEIQNPKCPHCNKIVAKGMYNRWHGDNCKHKK